MEVLTREDVRKILSVAGTRDRALVLTLIDSGLRRGEALALDWEDLELHTGAVHVRRRKGGNARVTYIGAKTRRALRAGACGNPAGIGGTGAAGSPAAPFSRSRHQAPPAL